MKPGFPWVTRLSSAGLVYVHFGEEILAQVLEMPVDSELVQQTYKKVYEGFIEEIVIIIVQVNFDLLVFNQTSHILL